MSDEEPFTAIDMPCDLPFEVAERIGPITGEEEHCPTLNIISRYVHVVKFHTPERLAYLRHLFRINKFTSFVQYKTSFVDGVCDQKSMQTPCQSRGPLHPPALPAEAYDWANPKYGLPIGPYYSDVPPREQYFCLTKGQPHSIQCTVYVFIFTSDPEDGSMSNDPLECKGLGQNHNITPV